jgi:hypothetical protein
LQILLKNTKPFHIRINTFKLFENGTSGTLYLQPEIKVLQTRLFLTNQPENALDSLYSTLKTAFPEVRYVQLTDNADLSRESEFEAHIGVGYFRDLAKARLLQRTYQKNWQPMEWTCNEIYIMR